MMEDALLQSEYTEASTVTDTVEVVAEVVDEFAFLDKPFDDYTTSEGLLLLIFVILFLDFILNILRRWF